MHFVGIGGIGMSGIAELLLNLGYKVSGSDVKLSSITEHLERLGCTVFKGHSKDQIRGADVVVTSSAIGPGNPEVVAAGEMSIPVIPRAEMLAELMRLKYSIAVAGTHGKTSTTSIIASVLDKGGLDPTVVIGGKLKSIGANVLLGQGDFIVAEADESDGSFLKMSPAIAVVTNIDREHLDFYKDLNAIKEVFLRFIDRVPFYGLVVLCLDNEPIQDLIPKIKKRFSTYGMSAQADFQARDVSFEGLKSRFSIYHHGSMLGKIVLNLPGLHNIYNSMAGIAVGIELNIPFKKIKDALETVEGVHRRLEVREEIKGITVVDDYGHHPTEIKATLQAAKTCWPDRRKVVVFQPHRYTRTKALFDDFTRAFYQADKLILLPIYPAGEEKIRGIDSLLLCEGIKAHGHRDAVYADSFSESVFYLKETLRQGDILLTLGAGDVWKVGKEILEELKAESSKVKAQRSKLKATSNEQSAPRNAGLNPDSKKWLAKLFGKNVKFNEPMSKHTSLRVGGPAWAFVTPESFEKLSELIRWSKKKRNYCMVIGGGTNLLVKDGGIKGIVVILKKCLDGIARTGNGKDFVIVTAMAGTRLQTLCSFAVDNGLEGMNFALGIPGTVGGAIIMNAGSAYGSMAGVIDSIKILLPTGKTRVILRQNLQFDYRKLSWDRKITDIDNWQPIILSGSFSLRPSDPQRLKKQAVEILKARKKRQPSGFPSAGCFFKNPVSGKTAGELIDLAGLKGKSIGGAKISSKHANFILNKGNASAADMLALMKLVQEEVLKIFNIELESEITIAGE